MSTQTAEKMEPDFNVADLGLAEWGRKEIRIAEIEMPGLVSIRGKYAEEQPLKVLLCSLRWAFRKMLTFSRAKCFILSTKLCRGTDLMPRFYGLFQSKRLLQLEQGRF